MPALFEFEGVTLPGRLHDVTGTVADGGITVMAGPSGSGKSTLLRCCNRLEAPTDGTLRFRGEDVATLDPRAHRRRVGMVFQSPVAFPGSVLDNVRVADPGISEADAADLLDRAYLAPDTPLVWSWVWVVAIVGFAGVTVARRAPVIPGLLAIATGAHALMAAVGLPVIYGFGIFPLEGRTLVPVAGMTIGNAMKAGIVGANRLADVVADHRPEIEARLALGLPGPEAMRPFLRSILRTAISPQIEQTAALGIVFLPGAMTGLIIAGVEPLDAVRTQLALMYVILAGVAITAITTTLGATRRLLTADDRLLPIARRTT